MHDQPRHGPARSRTTPRNRLSLGDGGTSVNERLERGKLARRCALTLALAACSTEGGSLGDGPDAGPGPVDAARTAKVELTPARVDFGAVVVASTERRTLRVTNPSSQTLEVEVEPSPGVASCSSSRITPVCFRLPSGSEDERFSVAGGRSVGLELSYAPSVPGPLSSSLRMRTCTSPNWGSEVQLEGRAVASGLACTPASVDFGVLQLGDVATATVTCENSANLDVTLGPWAFVEPLRSLSLTPIAPARRILKTGQALTLTLRFAPATRETIDTFLQIQTEGVVPIYIPVRGRATRTSLSVTPSDLDFGRVTLIAPRERTLQVSNIGFEPVQILSVDSDLDGTGAFSILGSPPSLLQPGETVVMTVRFSPQVIGSTTSRLRLVSNDPVAPMTEIRLRGAGVNLPACQVSLKPLTAGQALLFGAVVPGLSLRRRLLIFNEGSFPCLVYDAELRGDPSFAIIEAIPPSTEIPSGGAALMAVEMSPQVEGPLSAQLHLSFSSPSGRRTIRLSGEGEEDTLLIAPSPVDLGVRPAGCRFETSIRVYNRTARLADLERVELVEGSSREIRLLPRTPKRPPPLALGAGSYPVPLVVEGTTPGPVEGALALTGRVDDRSVTHVVPITGIIDPTQLTEETFTQLSTSAVDILFIIDKSGSTSNEQQALAAGLPTFIGLLELRNVDYRIGVTTADVDDEGGRLTSVQEQGMWSSVLGDSAKKVVTRRTQPSPAEVLGQNVRFQTVGGSVLDESGLRAGLLAFSPPLLRDNRLFRPQAALGLIFFTDEPDASVGSTTFYVDFYRSLKSWDRLNDVSVSGISAPFPPGRCDGPTGTQTSAGRYIRAAELTGGQWMSSCTRDWGPSLVALAQAAAGLRTRFVLRNAPSPSTFRVFVNGRELSPEPRPGETNWRLSGRFLDFTLAAVPPSGSQIRVAYRPNCP